MYDVSFPTGGIEIMVSNQERALKFYTQKLGFKKSKYNSEGTSKYVEITLPKHAFRISLVDPNSIQNSKKKKIGKKKIGTSTGVWFYTNNIRRMYDSLKSKGVRIHIPKEQPWGEIQTTFFDQDNNEYLVFQR